MCDLAPSLGRPPGFCARCGSVLGLLTVQEAGYKGTQELPVQIEGCQEWGTGWEWGTHSSRGIWEGLLKKVAFPGDLEVRVFAQTGEGGDISLEDRT